MQKVISGILALVITAGLAYGCYQLWLLLGVQIRGTLANNFKFIPAIIASFLLLTFADYLIDWVKRIFGKSEIIAGFSIAAPQINPLKKGTVQ